VSDSIKLIPTKSEKELAEELKKDVIEKGKTFLEAITKAHRAGFVVSFQVAPNSFGEVVFQSLSLAKHY